jgi:hypothetical protein
MPLTKYKENENALAKFDGYVTKKYGPAYFLIPYENVLSYFLK